MWKWKYQCAIMSDSFGPYRLQSARLLCPWNSPGKNSGVGSHSLLQGSSWPRDRTWVSHIAGRFLTVYATREAPTLSMLQRRSQFWFHVGSYFFDLPFVAFVTTVIHKVLALRTLHLCLTIKGLCSAHREIIWPCPPVNSYSKKKRLIHPFQRLAICGDILQDRKYFPFTPLSLSLLSFDFSSSLLLSPWL